MPLFYQDNNGFFRTDELRKAAISMVEGLSLINSTATGDKTAAKALHVGFWPFVYEFELAIDHRHLPREPLAERHGKNEKRKY